MTRLPRIVTTSQEKLKSTAQQGFFPELCVLLRNLQGGQNMWYLLIAMFHGCDDPSHRVALASKVVWLNHDHVIVRSLGQISISWHRQRVEGKGGVTSQPVLPEYQPRLKVVTLLQTDHPFTIQHSSMGERYHIIRIQKYTGKHYSWLILMWWVVAFFGASCM